jgi:hypothetical protein
VSSNPAKARSAKCFCVFCALFCGTSLNKYIKNDLFTWHQNILKQYRVVFLCCVINCNSSLITCNGWDPTWGNWWFWPGHSLTATWPFQFQLFKHKTCFLRWATKTSSLMPTLYRFTFWRELQLSLVFVAIRLLLCPPKKSFKLN